jgi:hypothetical protein
VRPYSAQEQAKFAGRRFGGESGVSTSRKRVEEQGEASLLITSQHARYFLTKPGPRRSADRNATA